jgi:acetyl esterase
MNIDSEVAALLEQLGQGPSFETMSVSEARAFFTTMNSIRPPGSAAVGVRDRSIDTPAGKLNLRIYRPPSTPTAVIVYFHGGGWILGDLESMDGPLRDFALMTDACVVSVDYRLAPEHPFPAAVFDARAALEWAAAERAELADRSAPLLVAGDSAGGNLAAVVAIMARDAGGPELCGQLLFYPVTDADFSTGSYIEHAEGKFLTRAMMMWFWDHYVPDGARRKDFRAAPLRAEDASRLPPILVQTAEHDPLRDEAEAYAMLLARAGCNVSIQRRQGLIHGYLGMAAVSASARAAIADAVHWVRSTVALARESKGNDVS